jgi:arsenate reductase
MKKRILFLCTGNAARSQMAEAIANAFHGDVIEAVSAGSRPTGWVHPLAVETMAKVGVDIS